MAWYFRSPSVLCHRSATQPLAGVLAGNTADVTGYSLQGPALRGIEAIRPRYEELFSGHAVAMRSEILEASGNGKSGFVIGNTKETSIPHAGGETATVDDRFVAIVRCVTGERKVSHLIWSPR